MRLKAIKLAGFKSFVDPTNVPFSTNMTAIVGPNGCGKSNTIDAVRWVMGESSAKYLRGDSMTDVIFNGSSERKPVGKASVDLVFDNSDGSLKGEYAAYSEVSVRRQVTRDGQSTYFLNGTKCRRKDVTDIFLGTGLGPRSYAIIEQGMISRLIEAKPEELRVYVEEAAGISKYKERRRDTENRIRRTQENLERLSDIRDELGRQLAHLERQAQAAEKYKALKSEEREKKAQLHALKWQQLDADFKEREQSIQALDTEFEGHMAEQRSLDAQIEELRQVHHEKTDHFNRAQGQYYEVGSHIARQEQKIEHTSQMSFQLDRELGEVEKALLDAQKALEQDQLQLETIENSLLDITPELEMLGEADAEAQLSLEQSEQDWSAWQDTWNAFSQRASEPTRQAEVAQARIQNTEQQLGRLQQQLDKLISEQRQLNDNPELEEIQLLQEDVDSQEMALEAKQEQTETLRDQLEEQRQSIEEQRQTLDTSRQQLQQMTARQATLKALQQAALGAGNDAVSHWLESHQLARNPRLAEQLQVQAGWEIAAETVLGDYLQAVVMDDLAPAIDPANRWLDSLSEGRLVLFSTTQNASANTSDAQALSARIDGPEAMQHLLHGIYTADDVSSAMALASRLEAHESVITPDGIWLSRNWIRVARAADGEGGVLARQQELDVLNDQIEELDIQVEEWETDLDAKSMQLRTLEQQRDDAQRELQHASQTLVGVKSQLAGKQARAEQFALRQERLQQEQQELREQQELERAELEELRLTWQQAMDSIGEDTDERERLNNEKERIQSELENARQMSRQHKDRLHQLQLAKQSHTSREQGLRESVSRLAHTLQSQKARKETLQENQRRDHNIDLDQLKAELDELLEQRVGADERMRDARQQLEQTDQSLRQCEQSKTQAEQTGLEVRNRLEKVRMECQALEIRQKGLIEQLQADDVKLVDVLEQLSSDANIDEWQQQLDRIGERISRLGAINLAAIDEYKTQSQRKVYLDEQNDDLEKALKTLMGAIEKIDRETRTRFKETFDKMNRGLSELFPKVFGGGHACLELTGDELLETGVAIMAQPPGKKNSTIHLLSGGEKALTAIALVFSIFKLNPAPFCMLDEVDAPLDDANVGRYARLVKAMSEKVQFIFITHNKIAMEMGDELMGVTMHEPGVSRLVSVNVEEAAQLIDE